MRRRLLTDCQRKSPAPDEPPLSQPYSLSACCWRAPPPRQKPGVWTDDQNRQWQGEFLRADGASAVFLVDGKEFPFPLAQLSAPDKLFIFRLRHAPVVAADRPTAAPSVSNDPVVGSARMADMVLDAYNAAFLVRENKDTFYKKPSPTTSVAAPG